GLRPRAPARPARRSACPSAPRRAQAPCARPFLLLAVLRPRPPGSPLFPYTTLFRSLLAHHRGVEEVLADKAAERGPELVLLPPRSEEHTSELQSRFDLVGRLLLEKNNRPRGRSRARGGGSGAARRLHLARSRGAAGT